MLKYAGEYRDMCQSTVTVIMSRDVTVKSCLEWLTKNYVISDGMVTAAALRLKMLCLHITIHWCNLTVVDTVFRRQKFLYKVISGKSIRRPLTVMAF